MNLQNRLVVVQYLYPTCSHIIHLFRGMSSVGVCLSCQLKNLRVFQVIFVLTLLQKSDFNHSTLQDHTAATIQSACWVIGLTVFTQNSLSPFSSHCRYLLQLHPLNVQHRPKSSSFCCCAPERKREKSFSHCRKSILGWAEVCKAGWRRGGAPQNYKLRNTSSVLNVLNMTKWWRIRKSEGGFMKPEMCLRITQTARGLAEMVCVTLPVVHFS